jgi:FimV-like protein
MITLILKSYLDLLLPIAGLCLLVFLLGLYFIFKKSTAASATLDADYLAIAGDDIVTTQLDLARAYIEADKLASAKNILKTILKQGSAAQRQEAKQLLSLL